MKEQKSLQARCRWPIILRQSYVLLTDTARELMAHPATCVATASIESHPNRKLKLSAFMPGKEWMPKKMTKSKALGLSSLVWGFGPGLIADELSNGRLAVYKEDPGECPM